jgi:LysR family glycine cleavage system transcriptional activator
LLLHDDTGDLYDGESFWHVWLKAANVGDIDVARGPHFSHAVLAYEAAIEGVGVLASIPALASEELATGRLVTPFELRAPLASAYYLACEESAATRPAVVAFNNWLVEEAAREAARLQPR